MLTDDIALTMQPYIGPKTAVHLLQHFGSAERIYSATAQELIRVAELRSDLAKQITQKNSHKQAEAEIKYCEKNNILPIISTSEHYPKLLLECGDYPHVLYYKGSVEALSKRMISVVGTRKITSYGQKMCEQLIGEIAQMFPDVAIVSGLAYGIDSASHRAAIANNLATIGVLANQLPHITPTHHTMLATEMIKRGGGVITEHNSQNKDKGATFLQRNRIIAGMSFGTLVVESGPEGGSLNTAACAYGYQRSVMAVPGRVGDFASAGTNFWIKTNKAVMVCSAKDIARELGWDGVSEGSEKVQKDYDTMIMSDEARALLEHINEGEQISIDALALASGMSISEISPLLLEMEMDGVLRMSPGKIYEKA